MIKTELPRYSIYYLAMSTLTEQTVAEYFSAIRAMDVERCVAVFAPDGEHALERGGVIDAHVKIPRFDRVRGSAARSASGK